MNPPEGWDEEIDGRRKEEEKKENFESKQDASITSRTGKKTWYPDYKEPSNILDFCMIPEKELLSGKMLAFQTFFMDEDLLMVALQASADTIYIGKPDQQELAALFEKAGELGITMVTGDLKEQLAEIGRASCRERV